jgi:NitT/TauT family transport system substrate-binding protein
VVKRLSSRRTLPALALGAALALTGCSVGGGSAGDGGRGGTVTVTVGYQSKTINTVTAGTLLRERGYLESELARLGARTGTRYKVVWQDYATGAPITAQMLAGKLDFGSMGDFPLLINAARGRRLGARTSMISVTGYNARGALNMIVTRPDSALTSVSQLRGKKVSSSIGAASDGTLTRALQAAGISPRDGVTRLNQQPAVGASALRAGGVDALSQFVAWPGLLVWQGQAKLLYDGSALDVPTLHGTVVRDSFADRHPDVVTAFLRAQLDATTYLHRHPLAASLAVAKATGLPPEVVYLYNGAGGMVTFDPTLKPSLIDAMRRDVPVLKSTGIVDSVDVSSFVDDRYLRRAYGPGYAAARAATTNPAPVSGTDPECGGKVTDPATASEVWPRGAARTLPFRTPECLLGWLAAHPGKARAAYVPDAATGTRWFADRAVWVADGGRFLPFTTVSGARAWVAAHPGARRVSYRAALRGAAASHLDRTDRTKETS